MTNREPTPDKPLELTVVDHYARWIKLARAGNKEAIRFLRNVVFKTAGSGDDRVIVRLAEIILMSARDNMRRAADPEYAADMAFARARKQGPDRRLV